MELAQGEEFEGVERLIYNAIKKKGNTAQVKIYNTDRRKAVACEEFLPDEEPLDPAETVRAVAEYIDQEADSHEKFVVAIKKDRQDSGTKYTIKGRKQRASLGGNNNNNGGGFGMGGNMGFLGLMYQQNQQLQQNSMQDKSEMMQILSKMNEDAIRREKNAEVAYYQQLAAKEKKKRKKKKKEKPSLLKSTLKEVFNSEIVQEGGKLAMENIFGNGHSHETPVVPITPVEQRNNTTVHANVAGTRSTTNPDNIEDIEPDELSDEELEALAGYDYFVRHQEPDAGLTIHAVCRMLVKNRNHFAAKSIRKMIEKEKDVIRSEKGRK